MNPARNVVTDRRLAQAKDGETKDLHPIIFLLLNYSASYGALIFKPRLIYNILAPFMKGFFSLLFPFCQLCKTICCLLFVAVCSLPFFILVPFCELLGRNNHVIWEVCLKVAHVCLWQVLWLAATVRHVGMSILPCALDIKI